MKDIEKVSSGKVKYDSLTGKSIIDSTISRFRPYMNKILGISNGNYVDTLLSKKCFHLKLTNCQPLTTYSTANHVMYCILVTSVGTYHLVISFTLSQRMFSIKSWQMGSTINQLKVSLIDGDGNEILSNFIISIVLHIV